MEGKIKKKHTNAECVKPNLQNNDIEKTESN